MHTDDFSNVGSFYINQKTNVITFLSSAEAQLLFSLYDSLTNEQDGFKKLSCKIQSLFVDEDSSIIDNCFTAKYLKDINLPVFVGDASFVDTLSIKLKNRIDTQQSNSFPASQVCKALSFIHKSSFKLPRIKKEYTVTDLNTKQPAGLTGEVLIYPYKVDGYLTVNPSSFNKWCKLLVKAKSFRTSDSNLFHLKQLFNI